MDVQEYLATLCIRPAELNAIKELPGGTKDALTPLILLAPWLSTSPLTRALDKFEEVYPGRPYLVDVDTYYQVNDNVTEAKEQWARIAAKPAHLETWWSVIDEYPNAQPCLLMAEQTIESARAQIAWAREKGRSFCIRLNFAEGIGSGMPPWMQILVDELVAEGAVDFLVVLEFGWVQNPLLLAAVATGYLQTLLREVSTEIPIGISCTSFPKDFTEFDGLSNCGFGNRDLLGQIRQVTNHPRLIFGDWGTTRPRSYGHARQPKHRIDYPTDTSWAIARDQAESVDLRVAAERVVSSQYWDGGLGIWGEQMIEDTADGQPFAIDSMQKMYAARINIHLHRQAFYGHLPPPESLDEEWSDDL